MSSTRERPGPGLERPPVRPRRRRSRRRPLLVLGIALGVGLCGIGAVAAYALAWPAVHLQADPAALARVDLAPVGVRLERVTVSDGTATVPVSLDSRRITPKTLVKAGTRLTVVATVRRAGWLGWIAGKTERVRLTAVAPVARVATQSIEPASGSQVSVRFTAPVTRVAITVGGRRKALTESAARRIVATGITATGSSRAGSLTVAAAPRSWEALGTPERVSWFPAEHDVEALVQPARAVPLAPDRHIELTLSVPIAKAFGSKRPTLTPSVPGHWVDVDDYTLAFVPTGAGYGLGSHVHVVLPQKVALVQAKRTQTLSSLTWQVPEGTTLRLQQVLAQLGYLPLRWRPAAEDVASTYAAQTSAAIAPPDGTFSWRWSDVPPQLRSFWSEGNWTTLTYGAIMRFEHDHDLTVDGLVGPVVWRALLRAAVKHENAVGGYGYVLVRRSVPQTLTLFHNGTVVLQARVNTGVTGAPTALGTWPVFERASTTTMSGVNPDGSHYVDPGIKWVSYFHGGEAIHGFNRATYGYPQSVGCVEAPVDTAARIWPYTPIGTLVTITA